MRCFHVRLVLPLLLTCFLFTIPSPADVLIYTAGTSNSGASGEVPVSFVDGANAPTVFGTTPGGFILSFSTPKALDSLYAHVGKNGFDPRLEAEDGSINILDISANGTFTDFLADVYGVYDPDRNHLNVTVTTANGGTFSSILPMNIGLTSDNFLNIVATNGDQIEHITLGTDSDQARFIALRDVAVSGAQAPVPEPSTLLLLGIPLLAVVRMRRK